MARSRNLLLFALLSLSYLVAWPAIARGQETQLETWDLPPVVEASSLAEQLRLSPNHVSDATLQVIELDSLDIADVESIADESMIVVESREVEVCEDDEREVDDGPIVTFGDWLGYNSAQDDMTWLFGRGDDLGMFSLQSFPTLDLGDGTALVTGFGVHFLNGPIQTDMPPRLFDFQMAYHTRLPATDRLMLDLKAGVGVFSDFEGSAREGVRSQGHAVGYFEWHPWLVSVAGVEVLDRDDYSVLPVAGVIVRPTENMIFDLVFPRPKAMFRTSKNRALYVSGELGGGTWAIERASDADDVVTYRDLRVLFGATSFGKSSDTAFEFGWAFDRQLSYRTANGDYTPDDAFLIQWRAHY